jgi:hypothetical protein
VAAPESLRFLSQASIWFQLALFWSTISKLPIPRLNQRPQTKRSDREARGRRR